MQMEKKNKEYFQSVNKSKIDTSYVCYNHTKKQPKSNFLSYRTDITLHLLLGHY